MMRRLFIFFMGLFAMAAWAQDEISVSYGAFPVGSKFMPYALVNYGSSVSSSSTPRDVITPIAFGDVKSFGSINVMYLHSFTKKLAAGVSYSYSCFKPHETIPSSVEDANTKVHTHSVMLTAKWEWLSKGRFSLYSRAGAGIRINKAHFGESLSDMFSPFECEVLKKDKTDVAWQVSALCADYKICGHFLIFAEAGAGTQGCIQAGIKLKY